MSAIKVLALALPLLAVLAPAARADSRMPPATNETWVAECGGCHLAFAPHLLSGESWRRVMAGLERHFGTDASVDERAAGEISTFLERHAAVRPGRGAPRGDAPRISRTPWFMHEHREIAPSVWKRTAIRSPANCAACHRDAERGDFSERGVRIPP